VRIPRRNAPLRLNVAFVAAVLGSLVAAVFVVIVSVCSRRVDRAPTRSAIASLREGMTRTEAASALRNECPDESERGEVTILFCRARATGWCSCKPVMIDFVTLRFDRAGRLERWEVDDAPGASECR
jgi:hypothetical protein